MTSFEANLLSRSTRGPRDRTIRQLRLPYHLVEPIAFTVDTILVVAVSLLAGIGYNYFFLSCLPAANAIQIYAAIGVLTLTNVSAILAARGDYRVSNLVSFYRQARDLTIIWTGVFLILVGVAFSLKLSASFSRGATLTFFALGLAGMIVWCKFLRKSLCMPYLQAPSPPVMLS